jgi:urea transporter
MNTPPASPSWTAAIPLPVLVVMRGIGQVFFQEHALTGTLFVVGIALSSPLMALGAVVGSAVGTGLAWVLKFDRGEIVAGIFGFNAALVGIASFFFFEPGLVSVVLMLGGCLVATVLTRGMRGYLPFPTYTTPFIVTTWGSSFWGEPWTLPRPVPGMVRWCRRFRPGRFWRRRRTVCRKSCFRRACGPPCSFWPGSP